MIAKTREKSERLINSGGLLQHMTMSVNRKSADARLGEAFAMRLSPKMRTFLETEADTRRIGIAQVIREIVALKMEPVAASEKGV